MAPYCFNPTHFLVLITYTIQWLILTSSLTLKCETEIHIRHGRQMVSILYIRRGGKADDNVKHLQERYDTRIEN